MTEMIEGARTSEDEGSLASIRERVKNQRVFSGHPAELAGPIGGDPDEEEPQGKHVQPPEDDPGETPGGEGGIPEDTKKGGEEEAGFKPKYKSQEEAEKAQREAERKMHEATTRAADLERENEELRRQKKPPESPAPPAPIPEEIEQQVAEVLTEVDNLDPYAEDYTAKRAKLWAKVATLRGGADPPDESKVTETVRKVLQEERQTEDQRRQKQDEETRSRNTAIKMAQEAGFDMTERSYDSYLFWDALNRAPMQEGVTLKEQVDFMIAETKKEKARLAAARSETSPEPPILERGARTPRQTNPPEEGKPRRLNDIREKWREQRRL